MFACMCGLVRVVVERQGVVGVRVSGGEPSGRAGGVAVAAGPGWVSLHCRRGGLVIVSRAFDACRATSGRNGVGGGRLSRGGWGGGGGGGGVEGESGGAVGGRRGNVVVVLEGRSRPGAGSLVGCGGGGSGWGGVGGG